ncbi:hypothetical protein AVEN_267476-1 [Araneus ventricosus]|uniref:Uncharacterized protein n=1 Tax=Araneus ventricosus TaxID=182803 RepID=A0A4Y2RH26_ARAVE|nr:hypothetical protein AVEN_267476-1 [Araneus ventricosus]
MYKRCFPVSEDVLDQDMENFLAVQDSNQPDSRESTALQSLKVSSVWHQESVDRISADHESILFLSSL